MISEQLLIEMIGDILLIIIVISILWYALKKDELRQKASDHRYDILFSAVTDATKEYANTLVNVIDNLPSRQKQMMEEMSKQHLDSIKLIIEELKVIESKVEESIRMRDEFIDYIKKKEEECEKNNKNNSKIIQSGAM